ncbi:sensor histidine kinase [Arundinibacter roseus]|uniref:histidine kinase n=1 Tax=Arundinibacter roseus TaxID=2070510 RepID=A0A4R4KE04_9BACT|nr:ATP-binding protein [Arundinibacter roseus]TDB65923.1 GHKL domain-containing protein [Arundinibacter roseus]
MHHFSMGILWRVLGLIAAGVGMGLVLTKPDPNGMLALILLMVTAILGRGLYVYVTSFNRKFVRFLESVRYSDFTIKFRADNQMGPTFQELNQQFNEVLMAFRQARAEKEANLQYLNAIVQHISTGLITFDSDGKVNLINNSALRLLDMYRIRQLSDLQDTHPQLYKLLSELETGVRELYHSPQEQPLAIQATTIQMRGKWVRIVALQNIGTELQQKEVEAWQNLTRVLRHEIMNSMTPIVSLVGTMQLIVNEDIEKSSTNQEAVDDLKEALQTLGKRSQGMMKFVNAYRDFTTLPKPNVRQVAVRELIQEVLQLLQTDITLGGVVCQVEITPETLSIRADADQIQQVLINLIKNALEALKEQPAPRLTIFARLLDSQKVSIEIRDNGFGIEPEALERIFIPFYTTKKTGSGIGLSLSRQILQQHNGQLTVQSEVGTGTSFFLLV